MVPSDEAACADAFEDASVDGVFFIPINRRNLACASSSPSSPNDTPSHLLSDDFLFHSNFFFWRANGLLASVFSPTLADMEESTETEGPGALSFGFNACAACSAFSSFCSGVNPKSSAEDEALSVAGLAAVVLLSLGSLAIGVEHVL